MWLSVARLGGRPQLIAWSARLLPVRPVVMSLNLHAACHLACLLLQALCRAADVHFCGVGPRLPLSCVWCASHGMTCVGPRFHHAI